MIECLMVLFHDRFKCLAAEKHVGTAAFVEANIELFHDRSSYSREFVFSIF